MNTVTRILVRAVANYPYIALAFMLWAAITACSGVYAQPASATPHPRYGHCSVTWKNNLYIFGGWDSKADSAGVNKSPFFYSTTIPLNTNQTTWSPLPTVNATNVGKAACVVTPSGHILVLGGSTSALKGSPTVTTQVYDIDAAAWISHKALMASSYPGSGYGPKAQLISPNFIAVHGGASAIFEAGQSEPSQSIYFLNMTTRPWTWSEKRKDENVQAPICQIFGAAKGNLIGLGGSFVNATSNGKRMYLFNLRNQWITPDVEFPNWVVNGAVGLQGRMLHLIAFRPSNVTAFALNLATMIIESNTTFPLAPRRNQTASTVFDGSDCIVIHGGCSGNAARECISIRSTMLIYNMTTRSFTTNLNVVTEMPPDQFELPLISGIDMNTDQPTTPAASPTPTQLAPDWNTPSASPSDPGSKESSGMPKWLTVFTSVLLTTVILILFFLTCFMLRRRYLASRRSFIPPRSLRQFTDEQIKADGMSIENKNQVLNGSMANGQGSSSLSVTNPNEEVITEATDTTVGEEQTGEPSPENSHSRKTSENAYMFDDLDAVVAANPRITTEVRI